jgi:hypothetical protein
VRGQVERRGITTRAAACQIRSANRKTALTWPRNDRRVRARAVCGFSARPPAHVRLHLPGTRARAADLFATCRRTWPAVAPRESNRTLGVGGSTPLGSTFRFTISALARLNHGRDYRCPSPFSVPVRTPTTPEFRRRRRRSPATQSQVAHHCVESLMWH